MSGRTQCQIIGRFVGQHCPIEPAEEIITTVLGQYPIVDLGHEDRPATLRVGGQNFTGYDGQVVPIHFRAVTFFSPDFVVKGGEVKRLMREVGIRQATGYELALAGLRPEFDQLVNQLGERMPNGVVTVTMDDGWSDPDGHWVPSVKVKGQEKTFRYFYAGNGSDDYPFPIGDGHCLVIGVNKEEG